MQLNIKNPDVVRAIKRLNEIAGQSATQAVDETLAKAQGRGWRHRFDQDRLDAIVDRFQSLPVLDDRAPDDMLYGPDGLPRTD